MNKIKLSFLRIGLKRSLITFVVLIAVACTGGTVESDAGVSADVVAVEDAGPEVSTTLMGPCAAENRDAPAPDCSGDEICLIFGAAPMCTLICESAADCPNGFVCQAAWIDQSMQCVSPPCGENDSCDEGFECRDHGCFGNLCVAQDLPVVECGF